MKSEARGLYKQFLSVRTFADNLRRRTTGFNYNAPETSNILTEYNDARQVFEELMKREEIDTRLRVIAVTPSLSTDSNRALLQGIEIQCDKALEILASLVLLPPAEELDKLQSLRKELEAMLSGLEEVYLENASQAIDEYEKGDHLASVLIASRVIICGLDTIPGANDDERIRNVQEKGIIDRKREDIQRSIVKASRKARNFFSHDVRVSPSPSDALSLLGDMVQILKLLVKFGEASKT
jgi:hypothetical protein